MHIMWRDIRIRSDVGSHMLPDAGSSTPGTGVLLGPLWPAACCCYVCARRQLPWLRQLISLHHWLEPLNGLIIINIIFNSAKSAK